MPTAPDCIFKRFVRVAEADPEGVLTYQASGPSLPRSRMPRPALEFTRDGAVTHASPGPADRRIPRPGQWEATADDELTLRWDDATPDTVLEIVSCDEETLQLRIRSGSLD